MKSSYRISVLTPLFTGRIKSVHLETFKILIIYLITTHLSMACTNPMLESLLKFRNYTFSSLKKEFDIQESDIVPEVEYHNLNNLTVVDKEGVLPGSFYYSGEDLAMIYIEDTNILSTLPVEEILETCGEGEVLRSRAGKTSIMHVYPEHGFALSTSGKSLDFMEVFPPTSIEHYKRNIYKEVLFRK